MARLYSLLKENHYVVYCTSCFQDSIKREPLRGYCIFCSIDSIKREPLRGIEIALFFEKNIPEGDFFLLIFALCHNVSLYVILCHNDSYQVVF